MLPGVIRGGNQSSRLFGEVKPLAKEPLFLGARIRNDVLERDKGKDETGTWGTDTMTFKDDELSYALGKQGGTRKKQVPERAL